MAEKVYLVGEHHYDLQKIRRYMAFFKKVCPDHITIELDNEGLRTRKLSLENTLKGIFESVEEAKKNLPPIKMDALYSFFLGAYYAAVAYKSKFDSKVDVSLIDACADEALKSLSHYENGHFEAQLSDFLNSSSPLDLVLRRVIGTQQVMILASQNSKSFSEVLNWAFVMKLLMSPPQEIKKMSDALDSLYFFNYDISEEAKKLSSTYKRGQIMGQTILKLEGKVIHCGGLTHLLDCDGSLYGIVKKSGVAINTYKLLEMEKLCSNGGSIKIQNAEMIAQLIKQQYNI